MKHVKTLNTNTLKDTMKKGGCGECQTSCQSACKTSCTVGNPVSYTHLNIMGRRQGRDFQEDRAHPIIRGLPMTSVLQRKKEAC